ncbi:MULTISPECIES: thioredoxin [Gulbenkiania]|uniref:Thioredoxin n=2 Tax=Gulbenkiania TaxID=397456 RepID=A0A0K6H7G5_9NEIS|nr:MULTISPECIES: thioredoxin [Gulbenkiania]TCW29662.1 thioredoxin [Gulbenkiania mobilis]CUA86839.1 thioredoxin [Gulbenkiania indica]
MATHDVTAETFNDTVDRDGIVILDFWAPWCGPCKSFGPVFQAASEKHADIVFAKINTEEEQALAGHFGIRSIPTLMVLRDRIMVFNQAGALSGTQFEQLISAVRELDMDKIRADLAEQDAS